ncbi:MAG: hypothetical protein PHC75_10885 [Burkholderiales bacterium]|nr:hypothetical protein [Burkholderiales bacterium]
MNQELINKIKEKLPQQNKWLSWNDSEDFVCGYNKSLNDTYKALPDIINYIYEDLRGKIEKLYQDEHPVDCIDGVTPVETYGYEETHNQALKQVLQLLEIKDK